MKASNMPTNPRSHHLALAAFSAVAILGTAPAQAHPHIWVTVQTTLQFDKGTVTGIRHRWLFDEYYSTMAIQGLDANNDGIYDRKELAELATINIDGLKEMGYFTNAKLAEQPLALDAPKDYWLEYVDVEEPPGPASQIEDLSKNSPTDKAGDKPADKPSTLGKLVQKFSPTAKPAAPAKFKVLALEFTIPFTTPVLAEAEGFTYGVYDPDFMIWFDLAKKDAAKLADNAPKGCTIAVDTPKNTPDLQNLSEAMFSQLGGAPGASMAKTVSLKCPKA